MTNQTEKPSTDEVIVRSNREFEHLRAEADTNARQRTLQMLHTSHSAELHSMINVLKKGSYVAPHIHWVEKQDGEVIRKGESFLALEGEGRIILFDQSGHIVKVIGMSAREQSMVWIPAGIWHTVVCCSPYFIVFENKTGPWKEGEDKLFHPLYPAEGDSRGKDFVALWEQPDYTGE